MWRSTHARLALALAIALSFGVVSRGDDGDDAAPTAPEPVAERGFPWLCFATTIGGLTGLYVFVRRREQAVEIERKRCGGSAIPWYCRACAQDVIGSECPRCRTANPFLHDRIESDIVARPKRQSR